MSRQSGSGFGGRARNLGLRAHFLGSGRTGANRAQMTLMIARVRASRKRERARSGRINEIGPAVRWSSSARAETGGHEPREGVGARWEVVPLEAPNRGDNVPPACGQINGSLSRATRAKESRRSKTKSLLGSLGAGRVEKRKRAEPVETLARHTRRASALSLDGRGPLCSCGCSNLGPKEPSLGGLMDFCACLARVVFSETAGR